MAGPSSRHTTRYNDVDTVTIYDLPADVASDLVEVLDNHVNWNSLSPDNRDAVCMLRLLLNEEQD
jgi:hypothetical protein